MRTLAAVLFVWVFGGAGCTPGYTMESTSRWDEADLPLVLHISEVFTDDEAEMIRNAADAWSEATGGQLVFFDIPDERADDPALPRLKRYLDDDTFGIYRTDKLKELDGLTWWRQYREDPSRMKNFDIFIQYDESVPFEILVMHEMGHALGLAHIGGAPAMMNDPIVWIGSTRLKDADIDAINWLYETSDDAVGPSTASAR